MLVSSGGKKRSHTDIYISNFPRPEAEYLSDEELARLNSCISDLRDRVIVKLLYELGCTQKEAVNVRVRDVDFQHFSINIQKCNTRNNLRRPCFISIKLSDEIRDYLSGEKRLDAKLSYLIQTRQSGKMTPRRIRQLVKSYADKAGLGHKNHTQLLRYTHLIHAYKKRVPISAIQHQVGLTRGRLIQILSGVAIPDHGDAYRKFLEQKNPQEKEEEEIPTIKENETE
jgi:integrase